MIKLVSLNVQGDMNHKTTLPFLVDQQADVVCLQEVFQDDIKMYEEALHMKGFFMPMMYKESFVSGGEKNKLLGPAIFTNHEVKNYFQYIVGVESDIPIFAKPEDSERERNISNIVLLWSDVIASDGHTYRVSATHFTWTPFGLTTTYQLEDMSRLVEVLDKDLKDFILVGDLNARRGGEAFSMLASKYKDNIPSEYESSLDEVLHRSPEIRNGVRKNMVDGCFTTPEYKVIDCKLVGGVSDHKAIVAHIEKNVDLS